MLYWRSSWREKERKRRELNSRLAFSKKVIGTLLKDGCLKVALPVHKKIDLLVWNKLIRLSERPVSTGALPIPHLRGSELKKGRSRRALASTL